MRGRRRGRSKCGRYEGEGVETQHLNEWTRGGTPRRGCGRRDWGGYWRSGWSGCSGRNGRGRRDWGGYWRSGWSGCSGRNRRGRWKGWDWSRRRVWADKSEGDGQDILRHRNVIHTYVRHLDAHTKGQVASVSDPHGDPGRYPEEPEGVNVHRPETQLCQVGGIGRKVGYTAAGSLPPSGHGQ